MSLIKSVGAGEQSTGFYKHLLDQSIRLHTPDNQYLTRTITSAGDRKKATFSFWIKQASLDASTISHVLYDQGDNSGTNHFYILLYQDTLYINDYDYGSSGSPGSDILLQTTRKFRDTSAWYNIVLRIDTTQSTEANRVRVYVNGTQETSFSTATYPSHNANLHILNQTSNSTGVNTANVRIGHHNTHYSDCYMSEINYCDGQSYGPDSFGETKDGIWIPKDTSGLTFGTNGFHLTFKDDVISEGFNTVTYEGTGSATANFISGIGFAPNLVWIKNRDATADHALYDSLRTNMLSSNSTAAEVASSGVVALNADGFGIGSADARVNSAASFVAWCWEAGGTPTADNSAGAGATPTAGSVKIDGSNLGSALAGTIPATRLTANTSKGFSVVSYTGNNGSSGSFAHGLSSAPNWVIIKSRTDAANWAVGHDGLTSWSYYIALNEKDDEADDSANFNGTAPSSTVVNVGGSGNTNDAENYIAYCWTEISGYSKFGSYEGNANTTGPSVTLGFEPALVIIKGIDADSRGWFLKDNTRNPVNPRDLFLDASDNDAEAGSQNMTFSSTGFQITNSDAGTNANGETFIYMAFADTRSAAFFKDVTTNGNNFTPVNLDYRDSVPDTPTNNFNTTNVLSKGSYVDHSNGNLTVTGNTATNNGNYLAFPRLTSGKYYYEQYIKIVSSYPYFIFNVSSDAFYYSNGGSTWPATSNVRISAASGGGFTGLGASTGDIIGIAVDLDSGTKTVKIYKNNSLLETINITTSDAGIGMAEYNGSFSVYNFGQDSSFAGLKATSNANADGNGHGSFAYAPPSGYVALCSQNLPEPAIIDGTDYFNTVLYTGNGSTQSITGVGFSPDWTWQKRRDGADSHVLTDVIRGTDKSLYSDRTDAEASPDPVSISSFDADGFSLAANGKTNGSSETYVAWNWLAGTAFSNDASATGVGTIDSSGQVNTKAGFSIVSWSGNTTAGATVGHGLGVTPDVIIFKRRDGTTDWHTYHSSISNGNTYLAYLNTTAVPASASSFLNSTYPSSSVITLGQSAGTNGSSMIAYCFHSVEGYSKFGSYTGNGNADGAFVYTGFRPAFTIIKRVDATQKWGIQDAVREPSNEIVKYLEANSTSAEIDNYLNIDYLSNGFKLRRNEAATNASGGTYIYLAFADQPFKFSNAR